MKPFSVTPNNVPNDGILFVNHQPANRSGHMGHALVEYAPGQVLAFYPNCSAEDKTYNGHSGHGWMEFKRSTDGGMTWSEPCVEPNSKALYDQNVGRTFMCEKAVITDTGRIILFYLQCDIVTGGHIWEPYFEPYYAYSEDNGQTFTKAKQLFDMRGRVYDAVYHDGAIYVLFNSDPIDGRRYDGTAKYYLFVSTDNGETFEQRSILPTSAELCLYGTMCFTPDGELMAYVYDQTDEHNLKYLISRDNGKTWSRNRRAYFENTIRNPQVVYFKDRYFMHGRGGYPHKLYGALMLYSSPDGIHWDDGIYLRHHEEGKGCGAYSNNLVVHLPNGEERLIIQSSHAYEDHKTNTIMFFVDI